MTAEMLMEEDDGEAVKLPGLPANTKNYMTPSCYRRLLDEREHLVNVERPSIVNVVSWAASNGDRSENIRIHGDPHQSRKDHPKGIVASQDQLDPRLRYPVMDDRSDSYAYQDIGKDLLQGANHLCLCIVQALKPCKGRCLHIHSRCSADEFLYVSFHVELFDQAASQNCDHKPQDHIDQGDPDAENAGQKHQAPQIHHGR